MLPSRAIPPAPEEIEISILGPGFGESVLIHPGAGRWLIFDSCIDARHGRPAALNYLDTLGVPPAAVALIVATHWHADHIRGLASMVEACAAAQFCCSMALNNREFLSLANLYAAVPRRLPAGPEELHRAFQTIIARRGSDGYRPIKWLRSNMELYADRHRFGGKDVTIRIHALSPGDESITRAIEDLAAYHIACRESHQPSQLTVGSPNHICVAMMVQVGEHHVLLGSDLEDTGDPLTGWSAVLSSASQPPAEVYKVAHHGSQSGHVDRVWTQLLHPNPLALLTPFRWGRHRLPNAHDRERILSLTDRAYITADPNHDHGPAKRPPKVEQLLVSTARKRWLAAGKLGHVRWRADLRQENDAGRIELFEEARPLAEIT